MNPPQDGLGSLRFSVLGAGRVGASLAHWAVAQGARLVCVASGSPQSANRLAQTLGGQAVAAHDLASHGEELLLIAVPDAALASAAFLLAKRRQASVALHTAGSRTWQVLSPLQAAGTEIGSLHPLLAFPSPRLDPKAAYGVVFGIDGDRSAQLLAQRLAHAWGALTAVVPPESRLLYHFAATLAAGGVATLCAVASGLAERLRLPVEVSQGYLRLAQSAIEVSGLSGAPAISGPVARGDAGLVESELQALGEVDPELLRLAVSLALETLRQLRRAGPLSDAQEETIKRLQDG